VTRWLAPLILGLPVASGCARTSEPAPAAPACPVTQPASPVSLTREPTPPPTLSHQPALVPAPPGVSRDALRVTAIAYDPKRAAPMISKSMGLVVARSLACERGKAIDTVVHLCGARAAAALRELLGGVRTGIDLALEYPEEPGLECSGGGPIRCTIAPHQECQPLYEIYFGEGEVLGISERDDWQGTDEARRALDDRIAAAMSEAECP